MRIPRYVVLLFLFTFAKSALAQQVPASAPQATALLQQALTALSGGRPLTDVTLSGNAERIAGSDDESGTVVIEELTGTGSRIDLTLPSGNRSEIRNVSSAAHVGSWSGPDGVSHALSYHNLLTDPAWFPGFTIAALLSNQNAVIGYVGPETRNGQSVIHVSASQQFPAASGDTTTLMQHLTQTDIYLDSSTLLPAAFIFNTHPDNDASLDIPVEMDFSGYLAVNGAQIPFHVQKFINNGLALDLQFSNAVLNSGLPSTAFTVAAGL